MSGLKEFAASFCVVCIAMGILYTLCPKGNIERAVKYVFSLIMLLCVLTSIPKLRSIPYDIETAVNDNISNADEISQTALRLTFETALKNEGIDFSKITVCTDKSEDGSIKITKVVVITAVPYEEIYKILGDGNGEYTLEVHL